MKFLVLILALPVISYATELTNPYMIQIKIEMQTCINQNMKDCLESICMASPDSCQAQCTANSTDKCKKLAGQHIDQN